MKNWTGYLAKIYFENTIATIIVAALVLLFGQFFLQDEYKTWLSKLLIPSFIMIVCLEICFIRENVKQILKKVDNNFDLITFDNHDAFHKYLTNRFDYAKEVQVISLASFQQKENERYYGILNNFVKNGGKYTRIFSDTDNPEVFDYILKELKNYEQHQFSVSILEKVFLTCDIQLIQIMIIDEKEVCLGGTYKSYFDHPVITIRHKLIVKFFIDYLTYLSRNSTWIKPPGGKIVNCETIKKRLQKLKKGLSLGQPPEGIEAERGDRWRRK